MEGEFFTPEPKDLFMAFVCVQGCFLDHVILNTNDIRTIRGASVLLESLALELMNAMASDRPILLRSGGSQAYVSVDGTTDSIRHKVAAFCKTGWRAHMVLRHGVADTLDHAERRMRASAYRDWTIPVPSPAQGSRLDEIDHARPATDQVADPEGGHKHVSRRTYDLRDAGARRRPHFQIDPVFSFHDMIEAPPENPGMVVANKLAVVYADGSGFGALSQAMGGEAFSKRLADCNAALGKRLVEWVTKCEGWGLHEGRSRLEILLWGGDDMTFVMPAWLLFPFLHQFFDEIGKWDFDGRRPDFRCGAIIAGYKVPIRLLRRMAYDAQDSIKAANLGTSGFSVDVFESAAPPFGSVLEYRQELYGAGYVSGVDAFRASDLAQLRRSVHDLLVEDPDGQHLTLRKLHDLLEGARRLAPLCGAGDSGNSEARDHIQTEADKYFGRVAGPDAGSIEEWRAAFGRPRTEPLAMAQMAQLRPYLLASDLLDPITRVREPVDATS